MSEVKRKLAAIMFTDIVGYTALMGSDEDKAFEVLRKNREMHIKFIEQFNGTLIKEMGDGMLISFELSSDAVRGAIDIQKASKAENISLKIGIHEGEMVFEGNDVFGDGVNIASRMQESCAPGEILVSEAVYNNLRNKRDIRAAFFKEITFKNVDHPIRLYNVRAADDPDTTIESNPDIHRKNHKVTGDRTIKKSIIIVFLGIIISIVTYLAVLRNDKFESIKNEDGRISIAVMPYQNVSGDTLYDWWERGIQNILITELSGSRDLAVRQNQTMNLAVGSKKSKYQASITPTIAKEIATDLEVKAFVMGSILKAGDKFRLTTQLYETETGEIFKPFELEGDSEDDFFIIADSLSASIKNFLEIRKLAKKFDNPDIQRSAINTESPEAFKHYLFGYEAFHNLKLHQAIDSYLKAIEKDPTYINAYIDLIFCYGLSQNDKKGREYLELVMGLKADLLLKEQLALEHLNAYFNGNPEQEITYLNQILKIDELNPTYLLVLGRAHQKLKQYSSAIPYWEKTLSIYDQWGIMCPYPWIFRWLGNAYHHLGEHQTENNVYRRGLQQDPDNPMNFMVLRDQTSCALSRNTDTAYDYLKNFIDISRSIGHSQSDTNWLIANIYEKAGIPDSAEYYYLKALEGQPDSPGKMISLARFLIDHERGLHEGIAMNEKALAIQPQNWNGLETRGWGLYKRGDYEKALKVLEDAWPLRPSSAEPTFAYLHIQTVKKALANQDTSDRH